MVTFDIQVKGAEAAVTLQDMADYLVHAQPRRAEGTLLERIVGNPDHFGLFVMTGRADDASSIHLIGGNWRGENLPEARFKTDHVKALLEAFAAAKLTVAEDGALHSKRKAHNSAFVAAADLQKVRLALTRILLEDQVTNAALEARIAERLSREHRIPADRTRTVMLELLAAVAEAKQAQRDVFPALREIVAAASPPSLQPIDYVERGDEADLFDRLSAGNVLLLSGRPRVGKSYTAGQIAAQFMPLGYDTRRFADVESAGRFLLEPGNAPRLALIDDPLGGAHTLAHGGKILNQLDKLVRQVNPQRKLLVAQGAEVLLAAARQNALEKIETGRQCWQDMSQPTPAFLAGLWRSLAASKVSEVLAARVHDALAKEELVLEAGCLEYLATHAERLGDSTPLVEIERLAREDAAQLSLALADGGLDQLAVALAINTSAQEHIAMRELAFVRGRGGDELPGKDDNDFKMVALGGGEEEEPEPPISYSEESIVNETDEAALEALERRRVIAIDERKDVNFNHPSYRAAAELLLGGATHRLAEAAKIMLRRGLFCLAPGTSRAAARNLEWIYDRFRDRAADQAAVVALAVEGLRALYPATRDLCFGFLSDHLSQLTPVQQAKLPSWIARVTSVKLADLLWENGEARLSAREQQGTDYFERTFRTPSREDVAADLAILSQVAGVITQERKAEVVRYLASVPEEMSALMAGRLLSSDEAVLRAEAAKIWLSLNREGDNQILARIFSDRHPSCALAALKGAIRGWGRCGETRRAELLDGLAEMASAAAPSAAFLDELLVFNRVEYTSKNPPWLIFERLMPLVMRVLPVNAVFTDGRLFSVAKSAVEALEARSIVALCDGWIDWLEKNQAQGKLQGEYALSVTEILFAATATEPELREGRVGRLLAFTSTSAKMIFVSDLIEKWDLLRSDERETLLALLERESTDAVWLRAVVLARGDTPPEVVLRLLPNGLTTSDGAERLLAELTMPLRDAIVQVYMGRPSLLWWLGTHHRGKTIWEPVVEAIARRPDHPLFELAWDHIAYKGQGERVALAVRDVGAAHAERIFEILLRLKVNTTGDYMPEAWAAHLRLAATPEQRAGWLARMVEASPVILDRFSDLPHWLTELSDRNDLLVLHKADLAFLELTRLALEANHRETFENTAKVMEALLALNPPILFGTCDHLTAAWENTGIDASVLIAGVQERRAKIFEERARIQNGMKQAEPKLPGWIDP